MASDDDLQAYYALDKERDRLAVGVGKVEFMRTIEIVTRTLPEAPAAVADIGGGPGRYTDWLVDHGYEVLHRDLVSHHVEQVRERHGDAVDTAVADACALDLPDESVDAALLLGPLYHLPDVHDRRRAVSEAARVTKPGGMIYGAVISRWAARMSGILVAGVQQVYPQALEVVVEVERTGELPPLIEAGFTGYTHRPDEIRADFDIDALELQEILAIEGVAFLLGDLEARLADANDRGVVFDSLRALEAVPELLGASSHILAIARRC